MEDPSNGASGVCTGYCDCSHLVLETVELSDCYCVYSLAFGLYIWNRMKVGKKQVKQSQRLSLKRSRRKEEKVPIEKLRWEKSHITAELKEKKIQYDNLGEQLAELDEVNERSRNMR